MDLGNVGQVALTFVAIFFLILNMGVPGQIATALSKIAAEMKRKNDLEAKKQGVRGQATKDDAADI